MNKFKYNFVCGFILLMSLMSVQGSDAVADQEAGYNIPGGNFRITDAKEIKDLEQKAIAHLKKLSDSENGPNLEFIRTKSAEYQVVAGMIWRLVAEINENKEPVDCKIEIWEKPWLDFVKLDVECGKEKRKYQWKSREDPDDLPVTTPISSTTSTTPYICNTSPPTTPTPK